MLEKLISAMDSRDAPFDALIRIDSIHFALDGATLVVCVVESDGNGVWTRWSVDVKGLREFRITDDLGEFFFTEEEHIVSRVLMDTWKNLSFCRAPHSAVETVGRLWIAHQNIAGDWIPFERYFNPYGGNLVGLLEGGYGQIAHGPSFLIDTYAHVLNNDGVDAYTSDERRLTSWKNRRLNENLTCLATLMIGESFLVAEQFEEQQL
jgi:hypothetical protein